MSVLQAGVPKSGNLWLYQILERSLAEGGRQPRRFITDHPIYATARDWPLSYPEQASVDVLDFEGGRAFCRISNRFREEVVDLEGYCARASHVWTHSAVAEEDLPQLRRFERIVYILRDPRDVALSMARFAFTPYMRAHYPHHARSPEVYVERHLVKLTKYWAQHLASWLRQQEHLALTFVCYERLLADFAAELDRLLGFLGLELDEAARRRVEAAVRFSAMRESRPDHLRAGLSGGWREGLSAIQIDEVAAIAGPLMRLLGYPEDGRAPAAALPEVPERLDPATVATAAAAARYTAVERWRDRAGRARGQLRQALARLGARA